MVYPIKNGKAMPKTPKGFTLVELMVVMAMVALLVSIALPRYFAGLERSREAVLKEDLSTMRKAIDHYYADKNAYPATLEDLVAERYLKFIPEDPITTSTYTWQIVMPPDGSNRIYDLHSGSNEIASDGTAYNTW